jgi:membrane-associated protein
VGTSAFAARLVAAPQANAMELISSLVDLILHLDRHLSELVSQYQLWVYAILFLIVFCETGLVVTPFLPGDSLLFAVGALAAVDVSGTLRPVPIWIMLMVAAIAGNEVNFRIGRAIGPRAFSGSIRWLRKEYLLRTQGFYERHGGKTIVISRFVPIVRTFAPFVAGVGMMQRHRFALYNFGGGAAWVSLFVWGGYLFGNVPLVRDNFGIVTIALIVVPALPALWGLLKRQPSTV